MYSLDIDNFAGAHCLLRQTTTELASRSGVFSTVVVGMRSLPKIWDRLL